MYICIYVYMYICIYVYMYICIYVYTYISLRIGIYVLLINGINQLQALRRRQRAFWFNLIRGVKWTSLSGNEVDFTNSLILLVKNKL